MNTKISDKLFFAPKIDKVKMKWKISDKLFFAPTSDDNKLFFAPKIDENVKEEHWKVGSDEHIAYIRKEYNDRTDYVTSSP